MPERRPIVNPAAQAEHVDTDTLNVGQGPVFAEQASSLGTPSSGTGVAYAKTDGKLYFKNDAGTEYDLTATGGGGGGSTPTVTVFNSSGTFINSQTGIIRVILIGGGTGGGSGRRGAAGTNRFGGGGGSTAGYSVATFVAADLPASIPVWIAAGGTGGAARTTDNTNGAGGLQGGTTFFGGNGSSSSVDILVQATGGGFASGGTDTANSSSQSTSNHLEGFVTIGTSSGYPASTVNPTSATVNTAIQVGTYGALGGGIDNLNNRYNGGVTQRQVGTNFSNPVYIAATLGGFGAGASGDNGTVVYGKRGMYLLSTGGGGGASGDTAGTIAGGRGGDGAIGSSGGGGGASTNGANSGAGGNGGNGLAIIIQWP